MTEKPKALAPQIVGLDSLKPDTRNARRRTERSAAVIERSLSEYGAARSIVVDEHGVVLAGNGTLEAAAAIGIERVLVVPTDGNTLVAVQRTDLSDTQKKEYAIADNRASDLSEFDATVIADLIDEDPDLDISPFFTEKELAALMKDQGVGTDEGKAENKGKGAMEVKIVFEVEADFDLFLKSLSDLASMLPTIPRTEARLQLVIDQFLSSGKA